VGKFCQKIGARRRHQHQVGPARQVNVAHGRFLAGVQQRRVHRPAGQCLHGQRRDECTRSLCHEHAHFGAAFPQPPHQLRALVGGDAAGHAEQDPFVR
jgi:hypothetical protein